MNGVASAPKARPGVRTTEPSRPPSFGRSRPPACETTSSTCPSTSPKETCTAPASTATTPSAGSTHPQYYFAEWKQVHDLIKSLDPKARIAGPNTSVLYDQVKGFLQFCKANDCLPDVITWHELSSPSSVRSNVDKYRAWESELGIGPLPINLDEYAYRYHLSAPGQMIQWMSAIENP